MNLTVEGNSSNMFYSSDVLLDTDALSIICTWFLIKQVEKIKLDEKDF